MVVYATIRGIVIVLLDSLARHANILETGEVWILVMIVPVSSYMAPQRENGINVGPEMCAARYFYKPHLYKHREPHIWSERLRVCVPMGGGGENRQNSS